MFTAKFLLLCVLNLNKFRLCSLRKAQVVLILEGDELTNSSGYPWICTASPLCGLSPSSSSFLCISFLHGYHFCDLILIEKYPLGVSNLRGFGTVDLGKLSGFYCSEVLRDPGKGDILKVRMLVCPSILCPSICPLTHLLRQNDYVVKTSLPNDWGFERILCKFIPILYYFFNWKMDFFPHLKESCLHNHVS